MPDLDEMFSGYDDDYVTREDGLVQAEQVKPLDLQARRAVRAGTIDETGMDKILGLVLGCLISPDMTIIAEY